MVTTLSDDENVPCSSKQKNRKNLKKNATGNDGEDIWFCRECGEEWDENGDDRWTVCDICSQTYH